jgi:hypothetical protein
MVVLAEKFIVHRHPAVRYMQYNLNKALDILYCNVYMFMLYVILKRERERERNGITKKDIGNVKNPEDCRILSEYTSTVS